MRKLKTTLRHVRAMHFEGSNPYGNVMQIDATPSPGEKGNGHNPFELLMHAVAACSGMDVVSFFHEAAEKIEAFDIVVDGWRDEGESPTLMRKMQISYHMTGDIAHGRLLRSVQLSIDKYCSVAHMFQKDVELVYRVYSNESLIFDSESKVQV